MAFINNQTFNTWSFKLIKESSLSHIHSGWFTGVENEYDKIPPLHITISRLLPIDGSVVRRNSLRQVISLVPYNYNYLELVEYSSKMLEMVPCVKQRQHVASFVKQILTINCAINRRIPWSRLQYSTSLNDDGDIYIMAI